MSPELIEVKYALDTFYFLVCGALVMWMAAGFTMLEAGMVRAKNTTEILTKNVALYAVSCTMYLVMGYVIMYGGSDGGILPDGWFGNGISNATAEEVLASNGDTYYSGAADFFFQVVFVATAMSIVSGAVAERMKLWAFLVFAVVMTGFIYPMQGMWKWGGGFLDAAGFQDNAVADIFVNTNAAACGGLIAALITAHLVFGKADLTMAVNGALAGLVAITAEPLNWGGFGATLIGAAGGILVVFSVMTIDKLKIDDPVGAISVHGVVGVWGLLAVCLSGNEDVTLVGQLTGIGVIFAWTFVTSLIAWFIIKQVMGIRVGEQEEYEGVDISECGIEAYPEFASK